MKKTTNELVSLISFLNLASEERPIEEYMHLTTEEVVDAKHIMVKLVDLAWDREVYSV